MILTVTLNSALDRLVFVENLRWREKNIAIETRTFTSGKGFNVAKALAALAIETTALGFVGRADLDLYRRRFELREVRLLPVPIAATRTNIKIIETDRDQETEVNERGATILPDELEQLRHSYREFVSRAEFVTMSGSIAPGVPETIYADLVREDARHVRDTLDRQPKTCYSFIEALRLCASMKSACAQFTMRFLSCQQW